MPHGESRRSVPQTLIYPPPACTDPHTSDVEPIDNDRRRGARGISHAADVERQTDRQTERVHSLGGVHECLRQRRRTLLLQRSGRAEENADANGASPPRPQRRPSRLSQLVSTARTIDRVDSRRPSRRERGSATRVAATTQMSSRAPSGASSPNTRSHSCCAVPEKPSTTRHSCATPSRPARSSGSTCTATSSPARASARLRRSPTSSKVAGDGRVAARCSRAGS